MHRPQSATTNRLPIAAGALRRRQRLLRELLHRMKTGDRPPHFIVRMVDGVMSWAKPRPQGQPMRYVTGTSHKHGQQTTPAAQRLGIDGDRLSRRLSGVRKGGREIAKTRNPVLVAFGAPDRRRAPIEA